MLSNVAHANGEWRACVIMDAYMGMEWQYIHDITISYKHAHDVIDQRWTGLSGANVHFYSRQLLPGNHGKFLHRSTDTSRSIKR